MKFIHATSMGVVSLAVIVTAGCSEGANQLVAPKTSQASASIGTVGNDTIPGSYIIMLKSDSARDLTASTRITDRLLAKFGGKLHFRYEGLHGYAVQNMSTPVARLLARDPAVAYIEPDMIQHLAATQSNPGNGLDRIDQRGLPLDNAFTYTSDGSNVNVYIIDTGVDTTSGLFLNFRKHGCDASDCCRPTGWAGTFCCVAGCTA